MKTLIITITIAMVGVFYLLTIREGHYWGGDFSMYIHHAQNIAEGIDYEDTGYIYNPSRPVWGPKTYPPIFPLLLSPIYKWFGLNLTPMKIEIVLIFLLFLLIYFLIFRNEQPFQFLVATVVLIGFNPYLWDYKDEVMSDIPFLFFTYLSLLFIHQAHQSNTPQKSRLLSALLAGLFVYLAYGTRSIGIMLIPSLFIYDIIGFKRPTQFTIIATLLFIFLMGLQTIFLHSDSSYSDQFIIDPKVIFHNLSWYAKRLSILWDNGYSKIFRGVLYVTVCVLAIFGYLTRIKGRITIFEIFSPLYLVPVIIWDSRSLRFLIPLIPLYIFYAFVGFERINFFQRKEIERYAFIIFLAAIFISYAGKYTTVNFGPIDEGIAKQETIELFAYIKENTGDEDVFIFQKPRVLSLYTGRSASVYHRPNDDKDLWDYFQKIGATYLIVGTNGHWVFNDDSAFLGPFVEKYQDNFEEVYSNSDFKVYGIKDVLHLGLGQLSINQNQASSDGVVSFVVLSHIYPLLFGGKQSDIDRLINEIENLSPDVLILPGDIIIGTFNIQERKNDVFESEEELRASLNNQWDHIFSVFSRLDIPIWIAPGNHDISSFLPEYRGIVREVFVSRAHQSFHAKSIKNYGFLFLDTASESAKNTPDEVQMQWLNDELSSLPGRVNFLFLHHPVWYSGLEMHPGNTGGLASGWMTGGLTSNWMQEVHPLLVGKVKFVFAGDGGDHRNFLFYEIRDGIHYYVNGSGRQGVSFLHIVADGESVEINPHFIDIRSESFQNTGSVFEVYWDKVYRMLQHKYFWMGIFVSVLPVTGLITLLSRRHRS